DYDNLTEAQVDRSLRTWVGEDGRHDLVSGMQFRKRRAIRNWIWHRHCFHEAGNCVVLQRYLSILRVNPDDGATNRVLLRCGCSDGLGAGMASGKAHQGGSAQQDG